MIGLINALKNYDENFGVKFSTYAYTYVFGEINKYVRENKNLKVSKDTIKLKKSIEKTKDILRQKLLREPTTLELSLILEMDEEKILEVDSINDNTKSLDYELSFNDNLYNYVQFENKQINPDILDLKTELNKLESDEKKLIYKRYFNDLTQSETSKELGISQVQVYRKETKVLEKLRNRL